MAKVIVSDKLFNIIWNDANTSLKDYLTVEEYISKHILNITLRGIDYRSIGFTTKSYKTFLEEVYDFARKPFKEIMTAHGYRISDFSEAFCIPVPTIKKWRQTDCLPFVKLLLLRYFNELSFKGVIIQEDSKRKKQCNDVKRNSILFDEVGNRKQVNKRTGSEFSSRAVEYSTIEIDDESANVKHGPFHGMSVADIYDNIFNN